MPISASPTPKLCCSSGATAATLWNWNAMVRRTTNRIARMPQRLRNASSPQGLYRGCGGERRESTFCLPRRALIEQTQQRQQHRRREPERPVNADRSTQDADGDAAERPHAEPGHIIEADDAAADVVRRVQLYQRLRHGVERQLEEAGE